VICLLYLSLEQTDKNFAIFVNFWGINYIDFDVAQNRKTGTGQVGRTRTHPFRRTKANTTPYASEVRPKF